MGMDNFAGFCKSGIWNENHVIEILENFTPIVVHRDDIDVNKAFHQSVVLSKHSKKVTFIQDFLKCNISSTLVRKAVAENQPLNYIIHPMNIKYIKENKLYKN